MFVVFDMMQQHEKINSQIFEQHSVLHQARGRNGRRERGNRMRGQREGMRRRRGGREREMRGKKPKKKEGKAEQRDCSGCRPGRGK